MLGTASGSIRARHDPPIALGTVGNVNMLPSTSDAYLRVDHPAEIVLDHQAGTHVARISIHRL